MGLRLGVLASHPIQYHAPIFRKLAETADVQVYFAHRPAATEQARAGFGVEFEWDVDLLSGYPHEFLLNRARRPDASAFFGCDTPQIAEKIKNGKFDAFLVMGWHLKAYWQAIAACQKFRIPVMVRGDSQLATPRPPIITFIKKPLYRSFLNKFDACLAVGQRSRAYYRHYGVPEERIYPSPHCVDNDFFQRSATKSLPDRQAFRRRAGMREGAKALLFVGKLIEVKRPFDAVKAAQIVTDCGLKADLVIVGSGPLEQELRRLASRSTANIIFAGFKNQSEIPAYYAASDLLILPSSQETWGLVVNEAMACGVPAVVSDAVGCGPDLISSETGRIYRAGDIPALAEKIAEFWPALGSGELAAATRLRIAAYTPELAARGIIEAATGSLAPRSALP